ncbi:MAG: PAS domain S-box protein [Nitrospirae bacterium]|nr:PAS domain S-box protein [Nitrospirota bacterium]
MSEAIENIKQPEAVHETDLLVKVARIISSTPELTELLGSIAQSLVDILNKDSCSICLFKPGGQVVCIEAVNSRNMDRYSTFCLKIDEEGIISKITKERRPLVYEDIRNDAEIMSILKPGTDSLLSLLAVPIIKDDLVAGVLMIRTKEPHAYGRKITNLLTVISHNISVALKNAEFFVRVKGELDELKSIHEVGKAITSILDIDDLLPFICKEVTATFRSTGCILRLIEGENLNIKASYGVSEEVKQDMSLRLGEGIAGQVATTGQPMIVSDTSKMPENLRVPGIEALSVLCVPIKIGEKVIGTLGIYDKKDEWGTTVFSHDELARLVTFASVSAIAIENAGLYRKELERENEVLSLYLEVNQTKDYLKSLIDNSPDAIIISDTDGIITSWNRGAEKIYGYTEDEALGKFLPMVPAFLAEKEKKNIREILQKQTIYDIETIRQKKDGSLIEVSLTLSPVLGPSGEVSGISGISRDISEKKRVEKELRRKNDELSKLFIISSAVRGTLNLDKLIRMVLSAVTMSDGLGFNRAILFLLDKDRKFLKGEMGVGPANFEEANSIWHSLSGKSLKSIIEEIDGGRLYRASQFDRLSQTLSIDLADDSVFSRSAREKRFFNISRPENETESTQQVTRRLDTRAFGTVPLISGGSAIGLLWVDNLFTGKQITDDDLQSLMLFTSHIASAIENARLFEGVSLARSELRNIFESITDMVFFTDKDSVIKRVNQAVMQKLGKKEEEIIGGKCYQVFHGKDEHDPSCPHLKTIKSYKPFVEEIEDPYLGGTFVISCSPIFDPTGLFAGTVHVARDITELNTLREKVAISERMAALGELAAKVAHEIRNPLVSIGGFARRLENNTEGEALEYSKIIVKEVSRLEHILKEILGFVKGSKAVRNSVDVNIILREITDFITPEVHEKGNRIIYELSESPVFSVMDKERIREAVLNIMTNANNATERGIITMRTWSENDDAVIEISDTGCGIRHEHLTKIFDPFFTLNPQGTGLGLSVTHKIVQEHCGKIEVESHCRAEGETEKVGTVFRVFLPLTPGQENIEEA